MPSFSLKQLLVSTALVAIGVAIAAWAAKSSSFTLETSYATRWLVVIAWFGGGAIAGAATLRPFRLSALGLCVGLIVQFVIIVIYSSEG